MDENYLDSLLNEVSLDKEIDHKIEEELDSQIAQEKRTYQEQQSISDEDVFNLGLDFDANAMEPEQDFHFSESQMDELDHLDQMADLDMSDLDFSDIDFDDLDVTKLGDVESDDFDSLLQDFEGDLDISNLFDEKEQVDVTDTQNDDESQSFDYSALDAVTENPKVEESLQADLNADNFDADQFLDSLLEPEVASKEQLEDSFEELPDSTQDERMEDSTASDDDDFDLLQALEEFEGSSETTSSEEPISQLSSQEEDDLSDILAMLDMDDSLGTDSNDTPQESAGYDENSASLGDVNIDDFEELPPDEPDKKQKLMELLFGEPDEDDIMSEEELAEIEAKKLEKKQKKEKAKKEKEEKQKAAKEEKNARNSQKKKSDQEKKILKAQKKKLLREQELLEAANEKKLNKPAVVFIFTLFLGATFLFFVSTTNFNYSLAIEKATNYFANQKYRKAYDEIVGVEVKEKDEDLKDRIYTVMYVERLYESYLNNMELGREEKALDSLLRGVEKYYEHYEEAKTLGITADLDYSFEQIKKVLESQYNISVEDAVSINQLDDYDYVQYINSLISAESVPVTEEEIEEIEEEVE